ncbi:NYN domain-containing protein [Candidatus Peregrinibacteria bacterium]|nr:NYN domain-containing protein [Candidatus Peregrinibacteria bacterium]
MSNLASHRDQRVAIFIDTQNLYHSAKSNFRSVVNYEELIRVAVNGRKLVRAFAYVIRSEDTKEETFFDALEELGIENRVKDLQVFHTGAKKADWDVGIAVDMIRLTEKVDVVVLASGDGDFLEVIRYCKSRGVRTEVMAFEKTTNAKLMEEADFFVDLGDKNAEFLFSSRRKINRTSPKGPYVKKRYLVAHNTTEEVNQFDQYATPSASTDYYAGSNLSSMNREATNKNTQVDQSIFSRPGVRKVKPVVGLPGKGPNNFFGGKQLTNDETRGTQIDNAFGNNKPKKRFS